MGLLRKGLLASVLIAAGSAQAANVAEQSREAFARLRQTEEGMAATLAEYDALIAQGASAQAGLDRAEAALIPLLPPLLRLSRLPPAAVLAAPVPPAESLRGFVVLRAFARYTTGQSAALAAERDAVAHQASAIATTLSHLDRLAQRQREEAAALDHSVEQARAERLAQRDTADELAAAAARHAANEAARAPTMRAAVAAVARPGPAASVHGAVVPVSGPIIRRWGEPTEAGPATGVTFQPPPGARVVSPCAGRVAFAGPFRSYGLLLIIDCGGGLHAVLAGFDRLDASVGLTVPANESVGAMAFGNTRDAAGRRLTLYVEIRSRGQPIDPVPFLGGRL